MSFEEMNFEGMREFIRNAPAKVGDFVFASSRAYGMSSQEIGILVGFAPLERGYAYAVMPIGSLDFNYFLCITPCPPWQNVGKK